MRSGAMVTRNPRAAAGPLPRPPGRARLPARAGDRPAGAPARPGLHRPFRGRQPQEPDAPGEQARRPERPHRRGRGAPAGPLPGQAHGLRDRTHNDRPGIWHTEFYVPRAGHWKSSLSNSGPAVSTPNAITTTITAPNTGRGSPNWFEQLPTMATAPRLTDAQNALDKDLRKAAVTKTSSRGVPKGTQSGQVNGCSAASPMST